MLGRPSLPCYRASPAHVIGPIEWSYAFESLFLNACKGILQILFLIGPNLISLISREF